MNPPQTSGTDSYVPDALNRYASVAPAGGAAALPAAGEGYGAGD